MPVLRPWFGLGLVLARLADGGETPLSQEQMAEFLRTANVMNARPVSIGKTGTWRLTLDDGKLTHDASFQSIDERSTSKDLGGGRIEVQFVDSYRYNIAAYHLAELLGLADMVPVSVERRWRSKNGSFTWWIDDVAMNENEMKDKGLNAPDSDAWSNQIYKVRVFTQLVHDTDRNRSNLLITSKWRLWMIDFSRAFRIWPKLQSTEGLQRCDRELYSRIRGLTRESLEGSVGDVLTDSEIQGLLARRDLLLAHYDGLIAARGESAVLYSK